MTRTDELRHATGSARELLGVHIGADPYAGVHRLEQIGDAKAAATGVAYELEQGRKTLLAQLASEYARLHSDKNLSEAKLDRLARGDQRYAEHIKKTAAAIQERERLQSQYWAVRSELEWDRASIAHLNALTKLDEG